MNNRWKAEEKRGKGRHKWYRFQLRFSNFQLLLKIDKMLNTWSKSVPVRCIRFVNILDAFCFGVEIRDPTLQFVEIDPKKLDRIMDEAKAKQKFTASPYPSEHWEMADALGPILSLVWHSHLLNHLRVARVGEKIMPYLDRCCWLWKKIGASSMWNWWILWHHLQCWTWCQAWGMSGNSHLILTKGLTVLENPLGPATTGRIHISDEPILAWSSKTRSVARRVQ